MNYVQVCLLISIAAHYRSSPFYQLEKLGMAFHLSRFLFRDSMSFTGEGTYATVYKVCCLSFHPIEHGSRHFLRVAQGRLMKSLP